MLTGLSPLVFQQIWDGVKSVESSFDTFNPVPNLLKLQKDNKMKKKHDKRKENLNNIMKK